MNELSTSIEGLGYFMSVGGDRQGGARNDKYNV